MCGLHSEEGENNGRGVLRNDIWVHIIKRFADRV